MFKVKFKKVNSTEFHENNCVRDECIHDKEITIYWYKNNKLHREDGPAVEYPNGLFEWYFDGICFGSHDPESNVTFLERALKSLEIMRNLKIK